ncbi:chaplin family protein, partial [uncultured Microbacterium sp.]
MRTYIKRALWGTLLAGGITLLGATAANAADTSGEDGLLSGTQADAAISVPVTVVGNAVSLLGDTSAQQTSAPASSPAPAPAPAATTSGDSGTASGTQAVVDVVVPVTVTDNAITVLGDSSSDTAAAPAEAPQAPAP